MQNPSLAVSLLIPMRNEGQRIRRCLDSLVANCFPENELEILVIDGASGDQSRAIVEERARKCPCIRVLDNPARIVSTGLNIGLNNARGRVIIVIGAHAVYPDDYIAKCVQELERTHADVVGGRLITRPGADTLVARAIASMTQHPFGVGGSAFRVGSAGKFVDTVPYGAYRREILDRVGPFNEKLTRNQDFELNARVRAAGGKLFLSSELAVTYYNVPSFTRLLKQAWGNGRWLAEMWIAAPHSFRCRHAVPLAFVASLLACLAFIAVSASFEVILGGIALLYGGAAIISSVQIAAKDGWKFCLPVTGLFLAHHVAYGMGTIAGIAAVGTLQATRVRTAIATLTSAKLSRGQASPNITAAPHKSS